MRAKSVVRKIKLSDGGDITREKRIYIHIYTKMVDRDEFPDTSAELPAHTTHLMDALFVNSGMFAQANGNHMGGLAISRFYIGAD